MVAFTQYGNGNRKAVALHGLFATGQCFHAVLQALDPNKWCIVMPDHRGYGASLDHGGPYNMTTIAMDTLEIADHLGWNSFDAIGHSMGGKAALRLAGLAPARIGRVVGIAPVWASPIPFTNEQRLLWQSSAMEVVVREHLISSSVGHLLTKFWCEQTAAHSVAASKAEAYLSYIHSFSQDDFEAEAVALNHEVLVIAGEQDVVTTRRAKEMWDNRLQRCELTLLADCGHWPIQEEPLRTAAQLEAFLGQPLG